MKFFLFIDESGCECITKIDPSFPIFNLTGVLFSYNNYGLANQRINQIKQTYCGHNKVVLHSRDIRKRINAFQFLNDKNIESSFINDINNFVTNNYYRIFSGVILLNDHVNKYGTYAFNPYDLSLKFILERTIGYFRCYGHEVTKLYIVIESRGKNLDKKLEYEFNNIIQFGSGYISSRIFKSYNPELFFKRKKNNLNGLQIADLMAYPISRYAITKTKNLPYKVLEHKFGDWGLKIFP